jgi:DNA processing protein
MRRSPLALPAAPRVLAPGDPDYPPALAALRRPPTVRVAGELPPLERAVAIVGTRAADPEALDFAESLGAALARAGCAVLSGGALGVDAAAHRGALEAGGPTVAVLGTGLDLAYPPEHGPLFERIAARGALLTEAPDGATPRPGRFLRRNALLAALARVIVVVQAPRRSGALSTAAHGTSLGRPVLVVPAAPWDPRGEGCLGLLRRGAGVCTCAGDVLSVPALGPGETPVEAAWRPEKANDVAGLDDDEVAVLAALGGRARHVEELAAQAGLSAGRAQRAVLLLLLAGRIEERDGGRYARARRRPT